MAPISSSDPILGLEHKDWNGVFFLIRQMQEKQEIPGTIYQWDATIRLFRAVEATRLLVNNPGPDDEQIHRMFLGSLINLGEGLQYRIKGISDQQLEQFGIGRANLRAYINDLEDTYLMFYGAELEPARKTQLEERIFGSA
jgi:hypothetical protein